MGTVGLGALTSTDVVQTLYLAFLGRPADPAVRDFLVERTDLEDPETVDALARAFAGSEAFRLTEAADYPPALVRAIYAGLFDRDAAPIEIATWTERLDDGLAAADLPRAVLASAGEINREALAAKLFVAEYATDRMADGGWLPGTLTVPTLRGNDALQADLARLDAAHEALSLEQIGASLAGNPLHAARVGTGNTSLMFVTQQHGDEPIGTESAMYLLDFLSQDTELAASLREAVTVTVVPRVNPDGFARWQLETGGQSGLVDPRLNDAGIDLNLSHDPADPADARDAPESAAVNALVERTEPDLVLDYHSQGNYRSEAGLLDTMSVFWPSAPEVDPEVVAASKRAVVAIDEALESDDYDQLTLYPGSDDPGTARNGFALGGTPAVLVEQRFGQEMFQLSQGLDTDYSALVSALTLEGFLSMKGIVEMAARGEIDDLDPALAERIPERIAFAEPYSDDLFA